MGNKQSAKRVKGNQSFSKAELSLIESTFKDLSKRSNTKDKTVSQKMFYHYFTGVPEIIAERLFVVFDKNKDNKIDYPEFVAGLRVLCMGNDFDRMKFLFLLFNQTNTGSLIKTEIEAMLTNVHDAVKNAEHGDTDLWEADMKEIIENAFEDLNEGETMDDKEFTAWLARRPIVLHLFDALFKSTQMAVLNTESLLTAAAVDMERNSSRDLTLYGQFAPPDTESIRQSEAIGTMSVASVAGLPFGGDGTDLDFLDQEQKGQKSRESTSARSRQSSWPAASSVVVPPSPEQLQIIDEASDPLFFPSPSCNTSRRASALDSEDDSVRSEHLQTSVAMLEPKEGNSLRCNHCGYVLDVRHCFRCGRQLLDQRQNPGALQCTDCGDLFTSKIKYCVRCGTFFADREPELKLTRKIDSHEGYLYKKQWIRGTMKKRWFEIKGRVLYYYKERTDIKPLLVIFLAGCFIEQVTGDASNKFKYGIEIIVSEKPKRTTRLYAETADDRTLWVAALKQHANVHNIEDFYHIGDELGVGAFSSVRVARSKVTGEKYAAKMIDKTELKEEEKEALRTEIAVLKLVDHPNIIKLKNVFETRRQISLVMSYVAGGDLLDRMQDRKKLEESVARSLVKKLLSAISYLHTRGIVHRDLKPENIMCCSDEDDDIMIGDFGLSKFAGMASTMSVSCGTLAYMAPEILLGKSYGRGVDMWSIGCIMYLILSGKLPFISADPEVIKEKTIHSEVPFNSHIWRGISAQAKDLIIKLLDKSDKQRYDVNRALDHEWFSVDVMELKEIQNNYAIEVETVGHDDEDVDDDYLSKVSHSVKLSNSLYYARGGSAVGRINSDKIQLGDDLNVPETSNFALFTSRLSDDEDDDDW